MRLSRDCLDTFVTCDVLVCGVSMAVNGVSEQAEVHNGERGEMTVFRRAFRTFGGWAL